ncbi:MAG TPA: DUF4352 domain-containing protein [Bryobacteraceae bacterium]|nr:DUF4352 domain-containing protein [Bryobacteraceae bacterium]
MPLFQPMGRRCRVVFLISVCLFAHACGREQRPANIGTFRMGERVQAGQLVYNVLDAQWKQELGEGGKVPRDRFLVLKVSITNNGGQRASIPPFELQPANGERMQEVTEGLGGVTDWLGTLRTLDPRTTEEGVVVFDAPMAAYKLVASDGGELENERFALIDIPVVLE